MKCLPSSTVLIQVGGIILKGSLALPENPVGLVIFSHGSGRGRLSVRNRIVAEVLNENGIATLLVDLWTETEEGMYENRFNVPLLTTRLVRVTKWAQTQPALKGLGVGYFAASTGAATALRAAVLLKNKVQAVVSRCGRVDLATAALPMVKAPTLLTVGSRDGRVVELNKDAYHAMNCQKKLEIVTGATHLFEESGKLAEIAKLAVNWFKLYLLRENAKAEGIKYGQVNFSTEKSKYRYFRNRLDAAMQLAPLLRKFRDEDCVLMAVPRGGVPVGYYLAKLFNFPMEPLLTKKLGHPMQSEFAIGAVSLEDSFVDEDHDTTPEFIEKEVMRVRMELRRRYRDYMGDKQPIDLSGKTVIIVDDGIATGRTILAALKLLRKKQPKQLVVAVPVAPPGIAAEFKAFVGDFVCVHTPDEFWGVGQFYEDFRQVQDEEVMALLDDLNTRKMAA